MEILVERWRKSAAAKAVAWVLVTVSAIAVTGGAAAAYFMNQYGFYRESAEEIRTDVFQTISDRYSVWVLSKLDDTEAAEDYFSDKNFQYGVVCASDWEELAEIPLNIRANYVTGNFTESVELEQLNIFACNINEETTFQIGNIDSLLGQCYVNHSTQQYEEKEIAECVYDTDSGAFYYATADGEYYPVEKVCVLLYDVGDDTVTAQYCSYESSDDTYKYQRDSGAAGYLNLAEFYNAAPTVEFGTGAEMIIWFFGETDTCYNALTEMQYSFFSFESVFSAMGTVIEDCIVQLRYWTRAWEGETDDTETETEVYYDADATASDTAVFDAGTFGTSGDSAGTEYSAQMQEIQVMSVDLGGAEVQSRTDYDASAPGYLRTVVGETAAGTQYYVLSYVKDPLEETDDLYARADKLITLGENLKYGVFVVIVLGAALFAAGIYFLFSTAGYRSGKDGVTAGVFAKMPCEICAALFLTAEAALIALVFHMAAWVSDGSGASSGLFCTGFLALCGAWLLLAYCLNIAVCVKCKKLWENSLTRRTGKLMWNGVRGILLHIPILWRWMFLFAAFSLAEWNTLIIFGDLNSLPWLWLLEKAAVFAAGAFVAVQAEKLRRGGERIADGDVSYKVDTWGMFPALRAHGEDLNRIGEGVSAAVAEKMKSERFKTELITNVSHDIKTPLTSIINYVDLLEKEEPENEKTKEYLEVLERQSARLKKLIEDLIEASKASTGNLPVSLEKLEAGVFLVQTVGEFAERTKKNGLDLIVKKPDEPIYIMADGRHFWRVIDNLMNNVCKYAQPQTRVYIDLERTDETVRITFRNTSRYALNITAEELMERFVRGDASRSTEGNGLGLSIAKSLMERMGGTLRLYVDGDLFKVVLEFGMQFE